MNDFDDERRVRRIEERERHRHATAPDFTGWSAEQVLLWAARNGGYEAVVEQANEGYGPAMVTPEEREAELHVEDKGPVESPAESTPAAADIAPVPEHGAPAPQPQWWEEKAQWRHRGPEDYDWEDDKARGYFCEVDYDPFEDA